MNTKHIKHIFKQVRDANLKYNLIENEDRVAAGVSGGKDSFTMLYFLTLLQKYTPLSFEVLPMYIDLGFDNDITSLKHFCNSLGLELLVEKTNIGQVVFDIREERSPCSLCANLRRGALNRFAKLHSCNKVALGHHLDDVVTTMFMSMLYEGRYNVFKPKTYLDRIDITVIRPLVYVEERDIKRITEFLNITPVKNRCPADGYTKRDEVRELVENIESVHRGAKRKFLSGIENINPDSFWHS